MAGNSNQNGWNEYSKLVLKELETRGDGIESLKSEIQDVKQEMTKAQAREDRIEEVRSWKDRLDDVVSPTQLQQRIKDIEDLKVFKTPPPKSSSIFKIQNSWKIFRRRFFIFLK